MTRLPYRPKRSWPFRSGVDSIESSLWRQPDPAELRASRVQRRLDNPLASDRAFLKLIRRKKAQPSRLNQRLNTEHTRTQLWRAAIVSAFMGLSMAGSVWGALFASEQTTLGGVPYTAVSRFVKDKPARDAYFAGDSQALHDRLVELEVEPLVKEYYRDRFTDGRFADENALELHIHQVMYDRSGYLGEAYQVDNYGTLSPVKKGS
ncbi:MAG: hypothetical protein AAFO06_21610 [Cyanobacteria bacterium J06597_16]